MFRDKKFLILLFLTVSIYGVLSFSYIYLEAKEIIKVSNPIGATLHDQNTFHLPQINYFKNEYFNLFNYKSTTATTPGQHFFYAVILKILNYNGISDNYFKLRIIHSIFNIFIIIIFAILFRSFSKKLNTIYYLFPIIFSPYFINGALYITTDNGALGFIALSMFFLFKSEINHTNICYANIANTLSILWRQNTIWLQLPLFVSSIKSLLKRKKYYYFFSHLIPLIALTYFVINWGGLTPKEFQKVHSKGLNFSSVIYCLALSSIFSIFYLNNFIDNIKLIPVKWKRKLAFFGILLGSIIGILIPSQMNYNSGRWGGYLWTASTYFPNIYNRSVLLIFMTIIGSIILVYIFYLLYKKDKLLSIVLFLSWILSTTSNFFVFHRYFEPTLLLFFSLFSLQLRIDPNKIPTGVIILSILLLLIFVSSIIL